MQVTDSGSLDKMEIHLFIQWSCVESYGYARQNGTSVGVDIIGIFCPYNIPLGTWKQRKYKSGIKLVICYNLINIY